MQKVQVFQGATISEAQEAARTVFGKDVMIIGQTMRGKTCMVTACADPMAAASYDASEGDAENDVILTGGLALSTKANNLSDFATRQAQSLSNSNSEPATVSTVELNVPQKANITSRLFQMLSSKSSKDKSSEQAATINATVDALVKSGVINGSNHSQSDLTKRAIEEQSAATQDTINDLRRFVERTFKNVTDDRLRKSPSRSFALDLMEEFGIPKDLRAEIANKIEGECDNQTTAGLVAMHMSKRLLIQEEEPILSGGVIALLGPTGAGKTTTAAKLATRYAQLHSARDVALVTTDQHRAAAREQLQVHGRRHGITVIECDGTKNLSSVLNNLKDYPLVIVDTAGIPPNDKSLTAQLNGIRTNGGVQPLLVVPANYSYSDLRDIHAAYSKVNPTGIIITKRDESVRQGGVLSISMLNDTPICYVTEGQKVPGEIYTPTLETLVENLSKVAIAMDAASEASKKASAKAALGSATSASNVVEQN